MRRLAAELRAIPESEREAELLKARAFADEYQNPQSRTYGRLFAAGLRTLIDGHDPEPGLAAAYSHLSTHASAQAAASN